MLKQLVAEGFTFSVKDHNRMGRLILHDQTTQHVEHAVHCARRFSGTIGQRRKRMIGPVKVR